MSGFTPELLDLTLVWDFATGTLRAPAPADASDVATKSYVDAATAALDYKVSCRCTTTRNLSMEGTSPVYNDVGGASGRGPRARASACSVERGAHLSAG